MSEIVNSRQVFSLFEVVKSIQKTLSGRYTSAFWVKAEMIKLHHYVQSGHCYPDLVEKKDGAVIAQIKANIWKDDFLRINRRFIEVLKEPLKDGIKILFQAKITFEPVHGLALRILDIDPDYTLGDLEKEKRETIDKLKREGIYSRNKSLKMPLLPQRIAIISVETSKGYADFISVIENNPWKYKFFHFLFPSVLQGDNAVKGIILQLRKIRKVLRHFDLVAIIRGGGGDIGLSCYNDYQLAREVCLFPLPVITGIGHATNETVVEMISFSNAITPTKLAEYLLQKFHNFSVPLQKAEERIVEMAKRILIDEKTRFQAEAKLFHSATRNIFLKNKNDINILTSSLAQHSRYAFRNEQEALKDVRSKIGKGVDLFCRSERQKVIQIVISIEKDVNFKINQSKLLTLQQAKQLAQGSRFFMKNRIGLLGQAKLKLSERALAFLREKKADVAGIQRDIDHMNPENVLRRGYSITLLDGKAVTSITQPKKGDKLITVVIDGKIVSIVEGQNKVGN